MKGRIHGHLLLFVRRVIHYEFVSPKQSNNIQSLVSVMFTTRCSSKSTGWETEFCIMKFCLHSHCFQISDFFPRNQPLVFIHQSHSPPLAKCDFSSFPKQKLPLKLSEFESLNVYYHKWRVMKMFPLNDF
jgi:hypothetical protein